MRKIIVAATFSLFIFSCKDNDFVRQDLFTGSPFVYALQPASTYNTSGLVTFKERKDGTAHIEIQLSGTEAGAQHPVHLHMVDLSVDGATVAALLGPVLGSTGESKTLLIKLADESSISYKQLITLNACLKIRLSDSGPDQTPYWRLLI